MEKGKKHSEETKIKMSRSQKGRKITWDAHNKPHSEESKEKIRITKLGNKNPMFGKKPSNYKGDKFIDSRGYVIITDPRNNKKRIEEHRYVMEVHLNRKLNIQESIHHIDEDKQNNDFNNLWLFNSESDHQKYHWMIRRLSI